ncbi:MAG TPA: hypothetical protein VM783_09120 [Candidatus Acidoferrum sp.]|nr:hypothetical protein [Candidatus Acidoferrum sp.]
MAVAISLHSPLLPEVKCPVIFALSSNLLYQRPVDRSSGRTTDAARQVVFERLLLELTNLHSHAADYALRSGGVRIFQILVMGYDKLLWCRLQRFGH